MVNAFRQLFVGIAVFSLSFLPIAAQHAVLHDSHHFQPHYVLRVTEQEINLAGLCRLSAIVNGTAPGPAIQLRENSTSWIRVYNDFPKSNLTMHWHGLAQSSAPFSDGTPLASQWPIKPGHFFDYQVRPQIGEAGTYFYHSHVGLQALTAAGAVIVHPHDLREPFAYDGDKTLLITELFEKTDEEAIKGLEQDPKNFAWIGDAKAFLVNGKSYPAEGSNSSRQQQSQDTHKSASGPEVITVAPNSVYRMRVIGGVGVNLMSLGIESHSNLSIISVDGSYTKPLETDHIQVASGQRFDFLLKTKTETELKKLGKTDFCIQFEPRGRASNVTAWTLLSYKTSKHHHPKAPLVPPKNKVLSLPEKYEHWLEYALEPLKPNGFPSAKQVTRTVYITSAQLVASRLFWVMNNRTWTEDNEHFHNTNFSITTSDTHTPYLVDIYNRGEKAIPNYDLAVKKYGGLDPELNVYAARLGEVVDIVLVNTQKDFMVGYDNHPFHIHGGHVYDLGSGPGIYNATANEAHLEDYNPILRDTSILYKYPKDEIVGPSSGYTEQGWRAWRLNVTDPGVWMLHCHILPHMIMGMQSVWIAGIASEITRGVSPSLAHGYLTYGGSAYGNATVDPFVVDYYS